MADAAADGSTEHAATEAHVLRRRTDMPAIGDRFANVAATGTCVARRHA